jgi:hypothetical protein
VVSITIEGDAVHRDSTGPARVQFIAGARRGKMMFEGATGLSQKRGVEPGKRFHASYDKIVQIRSWMF